MNTYGKVWAIERDRNATTSLSSSAQMRLTSGFGDAGLNAQDTDKVVGLSAGGVVHARPASPPPAELGRCGDGLQIVVPSARMYGSMLAASSRTVAGSTPGNSAHRSNGAAIGRPKSASAPAGWNRAWTWSWTSASLWSPTGGAPHGGRAVPACRRLREALDAAAGARYSRGGRRRRVPEQVSTTCR